MNKQWINYQNNEKTKSSEEPPEQSQTANNKVSKQYGTAQDFMLTFNHHIQLKVAQYPERAYLGKAPSLSAVENTYNREILITWIMAQLENINDFATTSNKLNIEQMEEIANLIVNEYYYLKATEFQLFLYRLKTGRYGIFYGGIDPLKIMASLILFAEERRNELNHIERNKKQKEDQIRRERWKQEAISRKEYDELIKTKNHETRK